MTSGSGTRTTDPVTREAKRLAREAITRAERAKPENPRTIPAMKMTSAQTQNCHAGRLVRPITVSI